MNTNAMHTIANLRHQEFLRDAARHRAAAEVPAGRTSFAARLIARLWGDHSH